MNNLIHHRSWAFSIGLYHQSSNNYRGGDSIENWDDCGISWNQFVCLMWWIAVHIYSITTQRALHNSKTGILSKESLNFYHTLSSKNLTVVDRQLSRHQLIPGTIEITSEIFMWSIKRFLKNLNNRFDGREPSKHS